VGFVVDKVALGQVFSEYFGFSCQSSSTNCSVIIIIYHPGLVKYANSGRRTKWISPHPEKLKKKWFPSSGM
jgi:hypothetical protein